MVWLVGPKTSLVGFLVAYSTFNLVTSAMEVRWRLYSRRTPTARDGMGFPPAVPRAHARRTFSLIVPAIDEAAVLAETLQTLARQTHPRVQIVVSLAQGDEATIRQAEAVAAGCPGMVLVVKPYDRPSKPRQLNAALEHCDGDYVGVFDAEDDVAVDLLLHVEALIDETDADVVQGGVQLVNLDLPLPENATLWQRCWTRLRGWYCVHNDLEYYFWFSSRMFYQVDQGFVPLGGNTVFVRRELLDKVGGWPLNLTEDCALGVQLCVDYGAKITAAYDARLATREETPPRLFGKGSLDRQRRRWHQGFLSVLLDGSWLRLPSIQQRVMAGYVLAMPFIQAANAVMLPVSIAAILWLTAPVGWVLWTFSPLVPMITTLWVQVVGLREFAGQFQRKVRLRHTLSLIFGYHLYQMILAWSAVMGVRRLMAGQNSWLKTTHAGVHRTQPLGGTKIYVQRTADGRASTGLAAETEEAVA